MITRKEIDPFVRLLRIIDAIPNGYVRDYEPLAHHVPGTWPTVHDLRDLVTAYHTTNAQRKECRNDTQPE